MFKKNISKANNTNEQLIKCLNQINYLENKIEVMSQEENILKDEVKMLKECVLDMHREVEECYDVNRKPILLNRPYTVEESFQLIKDKIPYAYSQYEKLLENNKEAYEGLPIDSCSMKGHVEAGNFQRFLRRYLKGYILDIGCGPQSVPLYLEGYDMDKIYGLDPLEPVEKHPFHFQQGIGEYIPWEDNSFDCVIFCTSFDHVFIVNQVLDEVKRVCKEKAYVVFWVSFDENAPKYDPYSDTFKPYDKYHMFHYCKDNFEKDMSMYFDKIEYFKSGPNSHFYAYIIN